LNSDAPLDSCINAIRKQERKIQQKKQARYRLKAVLRRYKSKSDDSDDDKPTPTKKAWRVEVVTPEKADKAENSKFEGELDTTGKGCCASRRIAGIKWKMQTKNLSENIMPR
jgi:hypothetical protein